MFLQRSTLALCCTAALLSSCRSTSGLARAEANSALQTQLFSPDRSTQTVALQSGSVTAHPTAIDQYLYAKHWLDCPATAPGAFTTSASCRLNAAGRTYADANGWSSAASSTNCESCTSIRIPVAMAKLIAVDSIDAVDKSHATVHYTYTVAPNAFGAQLGTWTAGHPLAWCGSDPAVSGGWNAVRSNSAAFIRANGAWTLVDAGAERASFAAAFAPSVAASNGRPCPTS